MSGKPSYNNFSKKTSEWKDFFTLYQDRIVLGTDMEDNAFQGSPSNIIDTIKRFIETNDEFHNWDFDICGLGLDKAAIEKIYYKNFEYYAGDIPKKIDTSRLLNECNKMEELAAQKTNLNPYIDGLTEISKKIKQYI